MRGAARVRACVFRYLWFNDPEVYMDEPGDTPQRKLYLQRRQQHITLTGLTPGKTYELVVTTWAAGVPGRFWLSACAAEGDVSLKLLPSGHHSSDGRADQSPSAEESALMTDAAHSSCRQSCCVQCGQGPISGR
jgi:hypothetical protein